VETPCDEEADLVISGQAGVVMKQLMQVIRYVRRE